MKTSTTVFLACVFTFLSVYYFFIDRPPAGPASELPPLAILVLPEGDSVTWLEVRNHRAKETLAVRKEGSAWNLEHPVSYPAEGYLVKGMISMLTISPRVRRFPLKGKPKNELGLETPGLEVSLETAKGSGRRSLRVGAESPLGSGVYAQWTGEEEYFLIPPEVRAALERSAFSLRQKKLFRVPWDEVIWIRASDEGREYRLDKVDAAWMGTLAKSRGEIPLEKVDKLIYALQSLYVKDFLDGKNPLQREYGLQEKGSFLTVGEGGGKSERLILGRPLKAGEDGRYAVREKEGLLLVVPGSKVKSLFSQFQETFRGLESASPGKPQATSGKDSGGVPAQPKKPVRDQGGARDKDRPRGSNPRGV